MKDIKTILFDIDGTILDTTEFILQASEHSLAANGYPARTRAEIAAHVGESFDDFYGALAQTRLRENLDSLQKAHRDFQKANFNLSKLYPAARETLEELSRRGYKLGAVTSRSKITSLQTLSEAGVSHLFAAVISAEDAADIKPSPVPLLKALDDLGGRPEEAAMVGDSHLDIAAGKAAGLKTVRATYGFHSNSLHEPEPDYFVDDIGALLALFP